MALCLPSIETRLQQATTELEAPPAPSTALHNQVFRSTEQHIEAVVSAVVNHVMEHVLPTAVELAVKHTVPSSVSRGIEQAIPILLSDFGAQMIEKRTALEQHSGELKKKQLALEEEEKGINSRRQQLDDRERSLNEKAKRVHQDQLTLGEAGATQLEKDAAVAKEMRVLKERLAELEDSEKKSKQQLELEKDRTQQLAQEVLDLKAIQRKVIEKMKQARDQAQSVDAQKADVEKQVAQLVDEKADLKFALETEKATSKVAIRNLRVMLKQQGANAPNLWEPCGLRP